MKVLDLLNQERVVAERRKMIYSIEQRLAQGREENLVTQVSLLSDAKPSESSGALRTILDSRVTLPWSF